MKKIAQIRFFGDTNAFAFADGSGMIYSNMAVNSPSDLISTELWEGAAFSQYMPIIQLGIQALPGTRFYLGNTTDNPIIIGASGMYELDVTNSSQAITKLSIDKNSLDAITANPDGYLIVDIIYDDEE